MTLPQHISSNELLARLAFWRVNGVGPALMQTCLREFQTIQNLFEAQKSLPDALTKLVKQADWKNAEKDLQWLSEPDQHLVLLGEENYPKLLSEIAGAPPWLFVRGNVNTLMLPQIGIVGSRNPTHYGVKVAEKLASELSISGLVVTSGLALGIDAVCHQAVVDQQTKTVAVLAIGLDAVYPKRHQALAEKILEHEGVIVSEFGVGTKPLPENFPRRNRIISGLSLGTVVIEATLKSGSLITARYAAEQGREVFAVPGSIFQSLSQGCHALIKEGAKCVQGINDILEELPAKFSGEMRLDFFRNVPPVENVFVNLNPFEKLVLQKLSDVPQSFEVLQEQLCCSADQLQVGLMQLLLREMIQKDWCGYLKK